MALAGPQGTVVVGGAVDVRQSGTHTEFTQHSNTALLNHRSFDIGTGESVNFAQPSARALAVNRVVGSDLPTSIAGKLTANGNVWVLNPSGIAIQGTAQVNVGGLLATTASISDEAILSGEHSFAGAPAGSAVSNAGAITAGQGGVVLVAPVVSNTGTIATRGSDVALGAGSGFTVDFDGDGLTRFEVTPGSGVALTNAGTIRAEGGAAYISAASAEAVQTAVVSIGGRVEATRAEERGGVIFISGGPTGVTEVAGTLDASQATGDGGRIAVTGDRVDVRAGAVIDASGAAGGGTVEIGGGYQGAPIASPVLASAGAPATAPLPTARHTVVRRGARIAASAGAAGDGGTVIVWGDEATAFRGAIEARGGTAAGDGGFAEVSGRQQLSFDGAVDLSAAAGETGTLLLDPASVTIVAGGAGSAAEDAELDDSTIGGGDLPAVFTISAGAVAASVAAANTVIHATDTITQQAAIALSGDKALTFRTDTGDITLDARLTGAGNMLTLDAGGSVAFRALDLAALDVTANGSITQNAAARVSVGAARLDAGGGITLGQMTAGSLDVSAGGAISQFPGLALDVSGTARFEAGGNVTLAASDNDFSTIDLFGQTVSVTDRNALRLGEVDASALTVIAGGAITDTDGKAIDVTGTTSLTAADGGAFFDIALDGSDANPLDRPHDFGRFAASGEDISVVDADGIELGTVIAHRADALPGNGNDGDLTVLAGGSISQSSGATITAPGDGSMRSISGGITLTRPSNDFADEGSGHALSAQASGDVRIVDADSIALGASSGRNLDVVANDLSIVGTLDFDDTVRLTNAAGDLSVIGVAAADADLSTFEISDAEIAQIQALRIAFATGSGGIDVRGVTLDTESLALDAGSGPVVFSTAATTVAGDLFVTGASIAQDANAPLLVRGGTALSAAGDVTLASAGNDFDSDAAADAGDEVDVAGAAVTLVDRDAIALGTIDAAALDVRAGGSITDTPGKRIEVAGTTDLSAIAGADAFDIRLDNDGGGDRHDLRGTIRAEGEDIAIANRAPATRLGAITTHDDAANPSATTDATIGNGSDGDLTVISRGGPIVDVPGESLTVAGTTDLQASSGANFHDIALDAAGAHDFSETDPMNAEGEDIAVTDRDGIQLGRITARGAAGGAADPTLNAGRNDGALTVVAGGAITDTPGSAITVAGAAALTAENGTRFFDIALDEPARHDFGGVVSARGEDIILNDRSAIVLGSIDANAGAPSAPGPDNPIAFYDDNGDGVLAASEPAAAGDLTVRAGGAIADTGAPIDVEGRTRLEAVSGGTRFDITLDGPHDFDSNAPDDAVHEVDAIGRNVTLTDIGAIALGDIDASGDLSILAGGSVTDTAGEAVTVGDDTTILAVDRRTADPSDDDFFDIALDNAGLHDFASIDLAGEGIRLVDRQGLSIVQVDSRRDGTPDPTIAGDGIFLEVGQGDFAFETGPGSVPLAAFRSITLLAPNGSFETSAAIPGKDLPDGLTFRSEAGNITLDLQDGFVVQDVGNTSPFTLDAPAGISRIRIGEGATPEFLGIGTADFLAQAQQPGFNPLFNEATIGDIEIFRVTGGFGLIARSPLTVRFQNTIGSANQGGGTTILGTTFVGGTFAGFSAFGSFNQAEGTTAALQGFRDGAEIGELALVLDQANTVNGCAILVPSSCQPIGSLLPTLGYQDGLLLGIRFVAPTQDLDDPFTNRGDEEEWE